MKKILILSLMMLLGTQAFAATGARGLKEISDACISTVAVGKPVGATFSCLASEVQKDYYWREGWTTPATGTFITGFTNNDVPIKRMYGDEEKVAGAMSQKPLYLQFAKMVQLYQEYKIYSKPYTEELVKQVIAK